MSGLGQFVKGAANTFETGVKNLDMAPGTSRTEVISSGGDLPAPPPPPPEAGAASTDAAAKEQRKGRGKASNILAGSGYGLLSSPYTASRTLLGA